MGVEGTGAVAELAAPLGTEPLELAALFRAEEGYATPKVDLRGVIIQGKEMLLVPE